jgi:hypothetical protein
MGDNWLIKQTYWLVEAAVNEPATGNGFTITLTVSFAEQPVLVLVVVTI